MNTLFASVLIGGLLVNPFHIIPISENNAFNLLHIQKSISQYASQITVLMYHDFIDGNSDRPTVLPVKNFEEQMKYLHDNGYKTATMEELHQFINGEITLPKKTVVLTFDDGYLSNYIYAYPILDKYHLKATIFTVTSTVNNLPEQYTPTKSTHLSWSEIEKSRGIFDFQSHTHGLHQLSFEATSDLMSKHYDDVVKDLRISKDKLKADCLAYPYGYYNDETIVILKRMGFKMGFTVTNGRVSTSTDPYKIPRYGIDPNTTIEQFKKYIGEPYKKDTLKEEVEENNDKNKNKDNK